MSSGSDSPEVDDDEFWVDIQKVAPPVVESQFKTELEFFRSATMKNPLHQKFNFRAMTWKEDETYQTKMKKTIKEIRHDNDIQVEKMKQFVKASTKKDLKIAVEQINQQFEKEIHIIRLEYDKMKEEISKKNKEIKLIGNFLIDQEALISQDRLFTLIDKTPTVVSDAELLAKKGLRSDLNILKVQILGMKEATVEYSNETAAAAAKIRDLDQEIAKIKSIHKEEMQALEEYLKKRVQIAAVERDKVKLAFETFKNSGWSELEAKEKSLSSKTGLIIGLQQELKQAKSILHHPKLKLRVHNRLQDYIDEYEEEPDISPVVTSKISKKTQNFSKSFNKTKGFHRRNFHDTETNFTSLYSEPNPNQSKFHSRRSTMPDGVKTRLSPI